MNRIVNRSHLNLHLTKVGPWSLLAMTIAGFCLATPVHGQSIKWSLDTMVCYAQRNNISVGEAILDEQIAENDRTQARASRLPSLNLSGSQSLTRGTSTDPITYEFVNNNINSTSASLNSELTVYAGNQLNNDIRKNDLLVTQSSLYVQEAKNDVSLHVAEGYMEALYYHEGVKVAQENLETSELELKQTQVKYDAGAIVANDLAEVKSQYASAAYDLVTAKNSYAQQVLSLKQLLELSPEEPFDIAIPDTSQLTVLQIPDKMEVYYQALKNRPEVKAALLETEVKALDLAIARGSYLPSLSFSGSLSSGYTSTQEYSFSQQFDNNYSQRLGLSLTIPIFNRLQTKTSVQNARIATQRTTLQASAVRKELYNNIENAYQRAVAAHSEMEALKAKLTAAEENYRLTKKQHDFGVVSATDLVVNQNTWITTRQQYLQTKYRAVLYVLLLKFYEGSPITLS